MVAKKEIKIDGFKLNEIFWFYFDGDENRPAMGSFIIDPRSNGFYIFYMELKSGDHEHHVLHFMSYEKFKILNRCFSHIVKPQKYNCPSCLYPVRDVFWQFNCERCGAELPNHPEAAVKCEHCASPKHEGNIFCGFCGVKF